ncbi:restriction endonuclease subunit S [Megasphaera sp.]|uniref:restriction endonuclease subunit S n=1 Tax=Megasphaera sp. TaxID=2023260 RepID=UPI003A5BA560
MLLPPLVGVINKNLEEQLATLFAHKFKDNISKATTSTCPKLGDLITIIDNRGKTPPLTTNTFEYPIIDVGSLKGSCRIIDFNNCTKYVNKATYETWFRRGHPKPGDILISTVGSLGEIKIYLGTKGCIAQNVIALRAITISPLYLYQYLRFIRADLFAYNIGSVQPSIKVTHIIKHPIFIPKADDLIEFEKISSYITNQLYTNYIENDALKEIRDTLLPKLMSGEIDVSKIVI